MYRTTISGQRIVIRFPLGFAKKDERREEEIIQAVANVGTDLLNFKNECLAISDKNGLIIVYVQDGVIVDVQICQVVPFKNIRLS